MLIMFLILALIVPIAIFMLKMAKKRPYLPLIVLAILSALLLECSLFNVRHFQSRSYESTDLTSKTGYSAQDDAPLSGTKTIEINGVNQKIHNVYIDLEVLNSKGEPVSASVTVYMTDKSNQNYLKLPAQSIIDSVESTKYLFLITNGESENIKISFSSSDGKTFSLNKLSINETRHFEFKFVRFFAVSIILALILLLRPKSPVYEEKLSFSNNQMRTVCLVVIALSLLLVLTTLGNPSFVNTTFTHHTQYAELADAFLDGQLYLHKEVPAFLTEMENPYDYAARDAAAKAANSTYAWDTAYYDGHYYVYFGVLPVLLFYLPFKALTGQDLPNIAVIQILLPIFVIAAFLLVSKIAKKYFDTKKIPFASFILAASTLVFASGAVFIAKRPDFYSIPILLALTLTLLGLYFWLKALDKNYSVSILFGTLGSLCMALTAASRPQFLLASVFAVVIFWNSVFKDRTLFSKKGLGATVAMCLPYVIVGMALMWYNFARFGSPFDFGQNYNLTTNDMTGRGMRIERVGLALFTYFFQPPTINATFPFLTKSTISTNYLGTTITEAMFGGVFATIPLIWLLFLIPSRKDELKKNNTLPFALTAMALAFAIGILDAQGAGLLARYVSDFAYLLIIAAIFVLFLLYENGKDHLNTTRFLTFAFFATSVYSFLSIFAVYGTEIFYKNPTLFYKVSELVQFYR